MVQSEAEICNLALSFLGQGKSIVSLDEQSPAARLFDKWYANTRDKILRSYRWPFATRRRELTPVAEEPDDTWLYSYRYPVDCLDFHGIDTGKALETEEDKIAFVRSSDEQGSLILTNQSEAVGIYTAKITDVSQYDPDFVEAFALHLAGLVAPQLAGGDPFKRGEIALALWGRSSTVAQINAASEEHRGTPPPSYFERAR